LKFEQLKINEDETISKYFLRVEELVNAMKGLGEKIEESILVQKILRSLLDKFNPKVSAIEELNDLKTLSIDQCWSPVLIMFLPILYHKDLHLYTQYHPFWPCFDIIDIPLPFNGAT
jgi:hypothetical protein